MRRGREQGYRKMEAGTNRVTEDMNHLVQRTNYINDDDASNRKIVTQLVTVSSGDMSRIDLVLIILVKGLIEKLLWIVSF